MLETALPKTLDEENSKIQDCYYPEHCNSIGCKPDELLPLVKRKMYHDWSDCHWKKQYDEVVDCSSVFYGMPFCLSRRVERIGGEELVCNNGQEHESWNYCKTHPRERAAGEVLHSRSSYANWAKSFFIPPEWKDYYEFLRFRADDPREKALFLVAAGNPEDPALSPKADASILVPLSQKYDIRYQAVGTVDEAKKAIDSAAKTGRLTAVIFSAHAIPYYMSLSESDDVKKEFEENLIHKWRTDFDSLFKGLQPYGKIFLSACKAGADQFIDENGNLHSFVEPNGKRTHLAQMMADGAKRTVIAANENVAGRRTSFLSSDASMLYHPSWASYFPFYNTNIFKPFKPEYKNCSFVDDSRLHEKEVLANKVIHDVLVSKSLLTDEEKKTQSAYLKLCSDDPREKFLYFTTESDNTDNKVLGPYKESELLGTLSDKFDFEYSIVKTTDEICQKINKAAEYGEIAGVVVSATGNPIDGLLLSENNYLQADYDYSKCFSKLKKSGTIVLSGGAVGQNGENSKNLAQKIANDTQRTVVAATCPVNPSRVSIQSIDPFILNHPKWSFFDNLFIWCSENNSDLFKTFSPQQ